MEHISALEGRFVIDGEVDLYNDYGLIMSNEFDLGIPKPKFSYISVPGRSGDIDLTEALTGDAAYESRSQSFVFYMLDSEDPDGDITKVLSLLHGRKHTYVLGIDPDYTYTGRFTVATPTLEAPGVIKFEICSTADPYKLKEVHTTTVSAVGGVTVHCQGGRRPVHPLISCNYPVTVNWQGREFVVPSGQTYRMADVVFTEGDNAIWLNIYSFRTATWADVAGQTWASVAGTPWAKIVVADGETGADKFTGDGSVTLQWEESYL